MTDACILARDALGDGPPTTWWTTAAPGRSGVRARPRLAARPRE